MLKIATDIYLVNNDIPAPNNPIIPINNTVYITDPNHAGCFSLLYNFPTSPNVIQYTGFAINWFIIKPIAFPIIPNTLKDSVGLGAKLSLINFPLLFVNLYPLYFLNFIPFTNNFL